MPTVEQHREFFAQFLVQSVGSMNERLVEAFATVAREQFVGNGPWPVFVGSGYIDTVSDDPRLLYQDILIGLATDRGINNGQPTLHARCIAACDPQAGETVVHIGAGTGYYTAILAQLVGPSGAVTAYEIEPDLAARATANLNRIPNTTVVAGTATEGALPQADVIYVNAGATHPMRSWLGSLRPHGRLLFPLTPNNSLGVMLRVQRQPATAYSASVVCRAAFIPCIGARDDATSESLARALEAQSIHRVRSLRLDTQPDSTAWCVGSNWWLSTTEVASVG